MGDWHLLGDIVSVSPRESSECCSEACTYGTQIFNYTGVDSDDDDHLRRQLALPSRLAPISSAVEARARRALSSRGIDVGPAVMIYSAPGCQQQALHTDYDTRQMAKEVAGGNPVPYVVVVAVTDGTRMIVDDGETATVQIPTGSALQFAGDVVHAGASYQEGHARLHFYAKTSPTLEAAGRTFLIGQERPGRSSRRARWNTIKCRRDR